MIHRSSAHACLLTATSSNSFRSELKYILYRTGPKILPYWTPLKVLIPPSMSNDVASIILATSVITSIGSFISIMSRSNRSLLIRSKADFKSINATKVLS